MSKRSRRRGESDDSNRRLPPARVSLFESPRDIELQFDRGLADPVYPRARVRKLLPSRLHGKLVTPGRPLFSSKPKLYGFSRVYSLPVRSPSKLSFCVRRKQRREVLFALNRSGRHGRGRSYRRTQNSQYSCD